MFSGPALPGPCFPSQAQLDCRSPPGHRGPSSWSIKCHMCRVTRHTTGTLRFETREITSSQGQAPRSPCPALLSLYFLLALSSPSGLLPSLIGSGPGLPPALPFHPSVCSPIQPVGSAQGWHRGHKSDRRDRCRKMPWVVASVLGKAHREASPSAESRERRTQE